jgi:hypothetical protein
MIDPSIPLSYKPPQFDEPMQAYGKVLTLKNLMQQNQQGDLQIEHAKMVNEGARRDLDEETAFKQAVAAGKTPAELLATSPKLATAHLRAMIERDAAQLKNTKERNALLGNALGSVKYAADPAQRPALYQQVRTQAIQQGLVRPEEVPEQYDPAFVDQHFMGAIDADKQADNHQKSLDYAQKIVDQAPKTAKEWSDLVLQHASGAQSQTDLDQVRDTYKAMGAPAAALSLIPPMWSETSMKQLTRRAMTAEQRVQTDTAAKNATTAATNAENNVTEAELAYRSKHDPDPKRRAEADAALKRLDQSRMASRPITNNIYPGVPTTAPTGAAAQVHGEEYLKTLPPAFAARLKQMASGNEAAPTGRAAMSGPGLQLMTALYQFDPEWSPLLAQQRKETLKEFTSTQSSHAGGQLLALNTLVHHADLYLEVSQALKNGNWRPGNELYNRVASAFGSAPPAEANLVARFLASETGKVASGGVPAEGEINGILGTMRSDGSPDQMAKAGQRILQIAAGRMAPLKERRDAAKLQNFVQILGPDAQAILQRRGIDPETMQPAAAGGGGGRGGGGQSYAKTATGAGGHKIGTNDGGKTWFDVQTGKRI